MTETAQRRSNRAAWQPPLFCCFRNRNLSFAQPAQFDLQPPAAIPHSRRVAPWSKTNLRATFTNAFSNLQLERRSIAHAFLCAARTARALCQIDWRLRSVNSVHFTAQIRDCSKRFTINFNFFKPSSRYSLRRFFPTLSSKSAPQQPVCYHFEMQIKLSLQSRGLCVDSFPRWRPGPAEKPTPGATIPVKNTGFRAWECFHPWIHVLRIFFASQLLDDRVDMMMWCGWHDVVNSNHDHRP